MVRHAASHRLLGCSWVLRSDVRTASRTKLAEIGALDWVIPYKLLYKQLEEITPLSGDPPGAKP